MARPHSAFTARICTALMLAVPFAGAPAVSKAGDRPLLDRLRDGGYVLLVRPFALHDPTIGPSRRGRCGIVDEMPIAHATALGARLRNEGVSVTRVLASPDCRAQQTATAAFGDAEALEPADAASDRQTWRSHHVEQLVRAIPPRGNLVVVLDKVEIDRLTDRVVAPGEVLVAHPQGAQLGVDGSIGP